ncbi:MAG: hypothetical protein ACRELE_06920, partial [Gemmatimonadales bacterium]
FESKATRNKFLLAQRDELTQVPQQIQSAFNVAAPFKQITLAPDAPIIGFDPKPVIDTLATRKYCIVETSIKITEH